MALHDYTATEQGMLTVHEGELVEVVDISNEWCLVQPSSRQSTEGWVPTAYLKPYEAGGYGKLCTCTPCHLNITFQSPTHICQYIQILLRIVDTEQELP